MRASKSRVTSRITTLDPIESKNVHPDLSPPVRTQVTDSGAAMSADLEVGTYSIISTASISWIINETGDTTVPTGYKDDGYHWLPGGVKDFFRVTAPKRLTFITDTSVNADVFVNREE